MLMMILDNVPEQLRGELTRWLLEPKTGVFVGQVSAMVRDKLWQRCLKEKGIGGVVQAWGTNNEQGFALRTAGKLGRELIDMEGVQLVRLPSKHLGSKEERAGMKRVRLGNGRSILMPPVHPPENEVGKPATSI